MNYNRTVFRSAGILLTLGAFQLGLEGLFNFDLAGTILVGFPQITRLLFILIGVSGIYMMTAHKTK